MKKSGIGKMVDNSQFRFIQKLLRVTYFVKRFLENLKIILRKGGKVCSGETSTEELDSSIKLCIKHEQLFLKRCANFVKQKHSLRLFFDEENLLRCYTRISRTLNYGMRFILLQRWSNFTKLINLHHHDKIYYCGVEATH